MRCGRPFRQQRRWHQYKLVVAPALNLLTPAEVEQWNALDKPVPYSGTWSSGEGPIWAEHQSAKPRTDVLLRYGKSKGWLDEQPAAITRIVGKDASRTSEAGSIRRRWPKPRVGGDGRGNFCAVSAASKRHCFVDPQQWREDGGHPGELRHRQRDGGAAREYARCA